jgi:CheY-like chemotaxis protein
MIAGLASGPHIVLEVSDTGSGIPPDVAEHIFDPFFTTKMVGKGTGLGLSTVLGIVKSHGAAITLRSQMGSGTTFSLTIPAAGACGKMESAPPAAASRRGEGQLILIVDDEENVRQAASAVLELNGYRTLLAADGTQAVAAYAQNAGAIHAVITDLTMPYLDGVALVRALQRMQPDLPIIASSGQIENTRLAELKALGLELILKKPYSAEMLLRTLEAALDAGRPAPAAAANGENPS